MTQVMSSPSGGSSAEPEEAIAEDPTSSYQEKARYQNGTNTPRPMFK